MNSNRSSYLLALVSSLVGCSSSDGTPSSLGAGGATSAASTATAEGGDPGGATTGAPSSSGGTSSSRSSNGGSSAVATGGASTTGGVRDAVTGGSSNKGGASPGSTVAGGTANTGGKAATGGAVSSNTTSSGGTPAAAGAATGCGQTGVATGVQNLTIPIAGTDRSYVLFVPANYDANKALPLVFAWHGLGGTGTMARQYFGLEKAAANQAIFVYPSGLPGTDGKAGWTLTQDGVDVQFFDTLLADVTSKYCVDRARVFSTGHSFGAMMTNSLGCFRGNILRGIAPVAGMPPFGRATCTGAVAAWIAHGENDGTVDFTTGGIASRDFWIKLDTCAATTDPVAVEPSPCVAYQGCSEGHPVHWCVHQSDHNWPTFAAAGIWAFFNALK